MSVYSPLYACSLTHALMHASRYSCCIIESVDSNVGIARTRNIWQYIKISRSQKRSTYTPLWQYTVHLRVFSWPTRLPMTQEIIAKVPNQTAAKRPNSFLLSSDGLAQYCINLSRWFTHETAAFSTKQCTTPSLFHNFEALQGARSHSLKHYGFQFGMPFSLFVLTHAHLKIT